VERSNRETLRHLRAMMSTAAEASSWSDSLPLVQRIYNSLPNRSTGIAPARLLYGNAVDLDRQLLIQLPEPTESITYEGYLMELMATQTALVQASADHQRAVVDRTLESAPEHPTSYEVGDLVLALPAAKQPRSKLLPRWLGPMAIVDGVRDLYICQDLNTGNLRNIHVSRLKLYKDDENVSAANAALWDSEIALVDSIVAHRNGRTPSRYHFQVRWMDYGPEHDTWEPYKHVKKTAAFARYIRAQLLTHVFKEDQHPLDAVG
jgi:hypothetical protein